MKDQQGKRVLLLIGWSSVIYAFLFSSIFTGLVGAGIGWVIKKDYQERKQGLYLIIFSILAAMLPQVLGLLIIWSLNSGF
ncbi:hypothetical protein FZC78_11830 [Rossellomorea vietnamensis]|uniref:DUF4190 domain-containing protein n=1 Tax=Rossellomorea vietnamensis TaxID=218284 RepID=A0A5D4NVB4_9BACI|nr:hypothetical protein [Rossellomorea vietnamensis]TYS16672.1 hypothetical protein FZC78_11830 [Rossellomorea vietnamensis]